MDVTAEELRQRYQTLETDELLDLYRQGNLTDLAVSVLNEVLAARGLIPDDLKKLTQERESTNEEGLRLSATSRPTSIAVVGYGFVKVVEASLFYLLAFLFLKQFDTQIPPIGSKAYIIFVIIWPFVYPIVRLGLYTIPIIGAIFRILDMMAGNPFRQQGDSGTPNDKKLDS